MLIGQTVLGTKGGLTYYGPWFPRNGNAATMFIEVMLASGDGVLTVDVETKNTEDPDASASSLGTFNTILAASTSASANQAYSGFLELVRYTYTVTADDADIWVHFRANPPIWQPN